MWLSIGMFLNDRCWINLKLRDYYPSLDALCEDLELEKSDILEKLSSAGFEYNENLNKFW